MKKTAYFIKKVVSAAVLLTVLAGVMCLGTTDALAEPGTTVTGADAASSSGTGETPGADSVQSGSDDGEEYLADYLKFSREDLVSCLYANMDTFVGTPYHESPYEYPTPGADGHMQCEGFVWYVLHAVATENTDNIPCGDASTEPYGNGGGWVNWLFDTGVKFEAYDTIDDMLSSGTMRKGDIIWLFDAGGPYAMSDTHHTGFFWGDTPDDDKFWHSSELELSDTYAGEKAENRISRIEGMTEESNISEIWVIHLDAGGGTSASARQGEEVIAARRGTRAADADSGTDDTDSADESLPDVSAYAAVFDADWYRSQLDAGMADRNNAYQVTVGNTEYSIPRGSVSAGSMTDAELLQYFLLSGIWYGDQASPDFDISWYMENYADSSRGNNRLEYLQHYLQTGISAGEQGAAEITSDESLSPDPMSDSASESEGTEAVISSGSSGEKRISGSLPSTVHTASAGAGIPVGGILVILVATVLAVILIVQLLHYRRHR